MIIFKHVRLHNKNLHATDQKAGGSNPFCPLKGVNVVKKHCEYALKPYLMFLNRQAHTQPTL